MSESNIERMARAIARNVAMYKPEQHEPTIDAFIDRIWRSYVPAARAAVAAIVVTDEMVDALETEARFRMIGEESNRDCHRRAIAAAIAEIGRER